MMEIIITIGIILFLILLVFWFIKYVSRPAATQGLLTQNSQTVNDQQQTSNRSTNLPGPEETQSVRHRRVAPTPPSGSNVLPTLEHNVFVTPTTTQIFGSGDRRVEVQCADTTHTQETSSTSGSSSTCDGPRYRTVLLNREPQPNPIRRVVYTPASTSHQQPSTVVNQSNSFVSSLVTGTPSSSSSLHSRENIHTLPTIVRGETTHLVQFTSCSSSTTISSSTFPVSTGNPLVVTGNVISASENSTSGQDKKYTIPPIVREVPQSVLTRANTIHTATTNPRDGFSNVRGSSSTSPSSSTAPGASENVTGATGGLSSASGRSKDEKKYKIPPIATEAPRRVVTRLRVVHTVPSSMLQESPTPRPSVIPTLPARPALPARPTLPARPATPEPPASERAARTRLFDPYVGDSEPPEKKLDLRGLYLREAMAAFYDFFFHMQQVYESEGRSEDDRYIYIVTGYGKFSENRRPKIKPAVQEFIDENEIRHNWLNEGLVMIDFCAEEDEISDSDDYDDDNNDDDEEETNSDD